MKKSGSPEKCSFGTARVWCSLENSKMAENSKSSFCIGNPVIRDFQEISGFFKNPPDKKP
mgnify:CR=1 FL=1